MVALEYRAMQHPIELGNILLMVAGVALIVSGPVIGYRTAIGMMKTRKEDPKASLHWGSNIVNFLIAVFFFVTGICFVINNLRGNPLA